MLLMQHCAFVISLERATERFAHARTMAAALPLSGEILPAVDGSQLSAAEIDAVYQPGLHRPNYPFKLKIGEIGCFLSHRNAWKLIVQRKLDAALVLEDDVSIDQAVFSDAVDFVSQNCPRGAYVQFPVRPVPTKAETVASDGGCSLICPKVTPLRTSGQWVTQGASQRLLAATEVFDRPVDTFLQMHWITNVRLLAISPSGTSDMTQNLGGSTIGVGKPRRVSLQKVSREVNRAWYRWRIARLSSSWNSEVVFG